MKKNMVRIAKFGAIAVTIIVASFLLRNGIYAVFPPPTIEGVYDETSPFFIAEQALGNKLGESYIFEDQNGGSFDVANWFDKPLIVSYIYTNCRHSCPMITKNLAKVINTHKERLGKDFRVISVGFDFAKDDYGSMKKFGGKFVKDFENWRFLSGKKEIVKAMANKLGITYSPLLEGQWKHTIGVTIVAPGGRVFAQVFGPSYSESQIFGSIDKALKIKG